jgi:hypothetical protein
LSQSLNIVYLLLCHLNRHEWFEIPGIGVFNGNKKSSYIDHIAKQIHPGRFDIDFNATNTFRAETMIQNMISETGFEQELLEEHLAALCQTIQLALKEHAEFNFLPFGTLNYKNEQLVFSQSQHNIHQDFYNMGPLSVVPLQLSKEQFVPIQPIVIVPKPKKSNNYISILLALGLLWLIFLIFLFWPGASKTDQSNQVVPVADSTGTQKDISDTFLQPINTTPGADTFVTLDSTVAPVADTLVKLNNEVIIDSSNIKQLDSSIRFKPCIIIVGSFMKISNANRLAKKIRKQGYEVYRSEFGKFHRVGVRFNCFQNDLQQMLEELKKTYHPQAWVLQY